VSSKKARQERSVKDSTRDSKDPILTYYHFIPKLHMKMMRISLATALVALGLQHSVGHDLVMIARNYFPAGYANGTTSGVPDL
jgi:hypothetical protein